MSLVVLETDENNQRPPKKNTGSAGSKGSNASKASKASKGRRWNIFNEQKKRI